jgi:tetratricopeptide (TPR) repeat protein
MDEAIPNFQEAVRLLPKSADAHFHWAEALLKLGRKEEAIVHLSETLRINPNHEGAKYWLDQATAPSTAPTTVPTTQPATAPTTMPGQAPPAADPDGASRPGK